MVASKAIPFIEAPEKLDGTLAGDFGELSWSFASSSSFFFCFKAIDPLLLLLLLLLLLFGCCW